MDWSEKQKKEKIKYTINANQEIKAFQKNNRADKERIINALKYY